MSKPLVSVLMTAFNRELFIGEAIESVLASDFADFELIVVDDCSTDGTLEIARRYLSDPRVQVYRNEKNLGDYPNRNKAAEYARGEYLKYVDSDDVLYPHGLTIMVDSMTRFPDAGLGLSILKADRIPYPFQISSEEAYTQHFLGDGLLANAPLSTIIRRQAFWAVGGFSGLRYAGDVEMWYKLVARYPVVKMAPGLTWWRSHGNQEVVTGLQLLAYPRLLYQIGIEGLNSTHCPLTTTARQVALDKLKSSHARFILSLALKSRRPWAAYRLYRESDLTWSNFGRGVRNN